MLSWRTRIVIVHSTSFFGTSTGVMVSVIIEWTFSSQRRHLNNGRYISIVLRPIDILFNRALRRNDAGIAQTFLDTKNVRLIPWTNKFYRSVTNRKRLVNSWQAHHLMQSPESLSAMVNLFLSQFSDVYVISLLIEVVILVIDFSWSMLPHFLKI